MYAVQPMLWMWKLGGDRSIFSTVEGG